MYGSFLCSGVRDVKVVVMFEKRVKVFFFNKINI